LYHFVLLEEKFILVSLPLKFCTFYFKREIRHFLEQKLKTKLVHEVFVA